MRRLFKREDFLFVKKLQSKGKTLKELPRLSGWGREICRVAFISATWPAFRARVVRRIRTARGKRYLVRRKINRLMAEIYERQCLDFVDSEDELVVRLRRREQSPLNRFWEWITSLSIRTLVLK